jgi:uncharacterized membrane protein (DUF485 family)
MYQARKVNVPSQESEYTKPGFTFLAWYIHFSGLVHLLSWLGTFIFLAWYTQYPGLLHSISWLGTLTKVNVPSQESECTKPEK